VGIKGTNTTLNNPAGQGPVWRRNRQSLDFEAQVVVPLAGAVAGPGLFDRVEILSAVDGIFPGSTLGFPQGLDTLIRYCWLHSRGFPFYSGKTYNAGAVNGFMTAEQAGSVRDVTSGATVATGEFIAVFPQASAEKFCYQVVSGGTLETWTPKPNWSVTGWSSGGTTFTSGTATLVCIGPWQHSDGIQFTKGGHTRIYRCRIEGHANSAAIIQSALLPTDMDVPVQRVIVEECLLEGGPPGNPSTWLYVNTNNVDQTTSTTKKGGLTRSAGGVWSASTNLYQARPWGVQILNNYWQNSANGTVPASLTAILNTGLTIPDRSLFVRDEDTWKALVANQFDLSPSDPDLDDMLLGRFDWPAFHAAMTVNQSVLEARRTSGIATGACDARGAVIASGNKRAADDVALHPTAWVGTAGFDSDGYYIGT
jgi:hypothetical protein